MVCTSHTHTNITVNNQAAKAWKDIAQLVVKIWLQFPSVRKQGLVVDTCVLCTGRYRQEDPLSASLAVLSLRKASDTGNLVLKRGGVGPRNIALCTLA